MTNYQIMMDMEFINLDSHIVLSIRNNNKSTTNISISVRVDTDSKSVSPVTCVPNESWWSSEKTTCN